MKKKRIVSSIAWMICITAVILTGCVKPTEIVLSFDKDETYFSSKTELLPITGETLSDNDRYEQATIIIRSNEAVKMRVSVRFDDESAVSEGIKVQINNAAEAVDLSHNAVLYESQAKETENTISLKIYLAKHASTALKGASIGFSFVLEYDVEN